MIEIICVFIGWVLSLATILIRDFISLRNENIALLELLLDDFIKTSEASQKIIANYSEESFHPMPYLPTSNSWWANNKLIYIRNLPKETLIFDKWNEIDENLEGLNNGTFNLDHYASLTKETKNSLTMSLEQWRMPLYKVLFLRLIGKL